MLSFTTEANIAAAMRSFGALYCRMNMYGSFYSYSGGVYMGKQGSDSTSGGHAIVCYGFGTTSDGTPYWKCINSCATSRPARRREAGRRGSTDPGPFGMEGATRWRSRHRPQGMCSPDLFCICSTSASADLPPVGRGLLPPQLPAFGDFRSPPSRAAA